jgi:hypothetical protein
MKKILTSSILLCILFLTGCVKNELTVFTSSVVEFDAASWNANAAGRTYPMMTRVPAFNAATPTSQPALTRATGSVTLRVNLVGAQSNTPINFNIAVVAGETTAVDGTHYSAITGSGTIPANSSFGTVTIQLLNPGVSSSTARDLVLELVGNATTKASVNYSKVGLRISQL